MVLIYVQSKQEFMQYKNNARGVNVMFTGDNCPACLQAKPYFEQMARQHHGNFMIVDRYRLGLQDNEIGITITGIPTFVKYKNGQPISQPFAGFDYAKMQQMVTQH